MSTRREFATATFTVLNANHDGVLTLKELRKSLANTGITDEQIDQLYAELDTDHNGKVTEEEFVAGFDSVYRALMPVVEWAADLPEGAFSNFESRGTIIEQGEFR